MRNRLNYRFSFDNAARFCVELTAIGSESLAVSKGNIIRWSIGAALCPIISGSEACLSMKRIHFERLLSIIYNLCVGVHLCLWTE